MKILLKSATIIDENSPYHQQTKDILIEKGEILQIENQLSVEADQVYDEANLHLSPAWFDAGVSFGEPGFEERESIANGLLVAEKSGFSDIALVSSNQPCTDSKNVLESLRDKANHSLTKIHPTACLTKGINGTDLAELYDLYQAGARVFSDDLQPIENPNLLKLALQYTQSFGGCVASFPLDRKIANQAQVHESSNSMKLGLKGMPSLAESLQIHRDLAILEYTGGKLHIPLISTEEGINLIKSAKKKGLHVSCSVAIHHLFFDDEVLQHFDADYKVFPPLRSKSDVKALRKAVKDGVVDFVISDHRPMNLEQKEVDFVLAAFGSIGLESAFGAMNKLFGAELSVKMLTAGRKVYGLTQDVIQQKSKGRFTLFTTNDKYTFDKEDILSKSKNAIFLNQALQGRVIKML
ncbi:dihydroorotase [Psychroflexus planctonicus]|uniref:Dihydroorotase n=1 Tax=Psychroflexus planctonicus TaxID=1526575 RepID=A0ABQ1SG69_9FLAO|nr:dihydroorotase [Psychroflexus planctonicus]GGE30231.1 dihydroorotase [Psychroflexus planctonicus]